MTNGKQSLANYWPSYFFQYVGKSLSVFSITRCLIFSKQISLFPRISQALNLETLISISSYQLPMEYRCRLMRDMKFEVYFLTYQKQLIRFGMKVLSLS